VGGVPLPKPPVEPLHVPRHSLVELEAWFPTQGAVSEHPQGFGFVVKDLIFEHRDSVCRFHVAEADAILPRQLSAQKYPITPNSTHKEEQLLDSHEVLGNKFEAREFIFKFTIRHAYGIILL
jgi:hypothetical protein